VGEKLHPFPRETRPVVATSASLIMMLTKQEEHPPNVAGKEKALDYPIINIRSHVLVHNVECDHTTLHKYDPCSSLNRFFLDPITI